MQFLAPFLTFGLANALTFDKNASLIMLPDIYSALFSIIPAIIGMFIGKTKLKKKIKPADVVDSSVDVDDSSENIEEESDSESNN